MHPYLKVAYEAGTEEATGAFGFSKLAADEHGSWAPAVGAGANFLNPIIPFGGPIAAGAMAAKEAPEGRGLAHGLWAGGGQFGGSLGGAVAGTIPAAVLAALVAKNNPLLGIGIAGLGGTAGALYGGYKGTQWGQNKARAGDAEALAAKQAEDEHGSWAPTASLAGHLLPIPLGSQVAGGLVAAHEAPEGRGLVHGLNAAGGGFLGEAGGAIAGGLGGAGAGYLLAALTGDKPEIRHITAGLGGLVGGIGGGLYGSYKGTQWGQNHARALDAEHAAKAEQKG